jgi:hypothetical protein
LRVSPAVLEENICVRKRPWAGPRVRAFLGAESNSQWTFQQENRDPSQTSAKKQVLATSRVSLAMQSSLVPPDDNIVWLTPWFQPWRPCAENPT